ncbi:M23 family metallopeptidase [Catellatospora paridis]|uniref:M23 family metallopeptidase n=1 Tax=Catellatospora paridis TaxID=1617086 RepID=UPI0012D433E5|nr:M23 family metallopeptidase [Catellatospora paridis]
MSARNWPLLTSVATGVVLICCTGFLTALSGGASNAACLAEPSTGPASSGGSTASVSPAISVSPSSASPSASPAASLPEGFDDKQVANAAAIVGEGMRRQVPARGWVIAVATAMQESSLYNRANPRVPESLHVPHEGTGSDHDSLGLFQQRPSQGWGTPAQLMLPTYAAGRFYDALARVGGWQTMALTEAAQKVQKSAFPGAYAKHEAKATALVQHLAAQASLSVQICTPVAGAWVKPVNADVVSDFRTEHRPRHNGVDLDAARGDIVVAASAGTVVQVRCDISPQWWGCDRDGNLATPGCGWYVDIKHAGNFITRYCHLGKRPDVTIGDTVLAGQPIGVVGNSGHSSGPHLHFEVHADGDRSSAGAIPPVPYMINVGAALGRTG